MATIDKSCLAAIADALGLSADTFYTDAPQGEVGKAAALFLFWSGIGDAQGRRRVLSVTRQEVKRSRPYQSGDHCPSGKPVQMVRFVTDDGRSALVKKRMGQRLPTGRACRYPTVNWCRYPFGAMHRSCLLPSCCVTASTS